MIIIRKASVDDSKALSHICLFTADAGISAEEKYTHGELPGLIWALPYVHLPHTWGFVMENQETGEVVGYILGALDTRAFEAAAEESWWPPIRQKYPLPNPDDQDNGLKDMDKFCIRLIHQGLHTADPCIAYSPIHMHIDILAEYQRQGWGRRLISTAVNFLKEQGFDSLWLQMDPRNEEAKKFYERLDYVPLDAPGTPPATVGLKFSTWKY